MCLFLLATWIGKTSNLGGGGEGRGKKMNESE